MNNSNYPALYQAVNSAAIKNKQLYLLILFSTLLLITLGSVIYSIDFHSILKAHTAFKAPYILAAIIFTLSIGTSLLLAFSGTDKNWYNARSISESMKSRTWRFMVCGEPYIKAINISGAKKIFAADLGKIIKENKEFKQLILNFSSSEDQITSKMIEIREKNLDDRIKFYLNERINEQQKWYSQKSQQNSNIFRFFIFVMLSMQIFAVVTSILDATNGLGNINYTAIFASFVAAILAWVKVKQYQEIAQSYSITSHEIGLIKIESESINTEDDFAKFVGDAENAFSREHTLWLARKDNL